MVYHTNYTKRILQVLSIEKKQPYINNVKPYLGKNILSYLKKQTNNNNSKNKNLPRQKKDNTKSFMKRLKHNIWTWSNRHNTKTIFFLLITCQVEIIQSLNNFYLKIYRQPVKMVRLIKKNNPLQRTCKLNISSSVPWLGESGTLWQKKQKTTTRMICCRCLSGALVLSYPSTLWPTLAWPPLTRPLLTVLCILVL